MCYPYPMSKQGRRIVNVKDISSYMESITGAVSYYFTRQPEDKNALQDPNVVQMYQNEIVDEMVYRALHNRFYDHLRVGAYGAAVPAYGLRQVTEKDAYFPHLNENEKQIVRQYDREQYVSCKRMDRDPDFQYNFLYYFDSQAISPSTQEKLAKGVAVFKTLAYRYVEDQLETVRPKYKQMLIDFYQPFAGAEKLKGVLSLSLNYIADRLGGRDLNGALLVARQAAKKYNIPMHLVAKQSAVPQQNQHLF